MVFLTAKACTTFVFLRISNIKKGKGYFFDYSAWNIETYVISVDIVKWTPKTGQQFKWDTVTRNGVNHDRYKKAQRSPAGVQSQGGA